MNGAGINGPTPFLELGLEEWYAILDSQITGTFLGCQVFGDIWSRRAGGNHQYFIGFCRATAVQGFYLLGGKGWYQEPDAESWT